MLIKTYTVLYILKYFSIYLEGTLTMYVNGVKSGKYAEITNVPEITWVRSLIISILKVNLKMNIVIKKKNVYKAFISGFSIISKSDIFLWAKIAAAAHCLKFQVNSFIELYLIFLSYGTYLSKSVFFIFLLFYFTNRLQFSCECIVFKFQTSEIDDLWQKVGMDREYSKLTLAAHYSMDNNTS
ncbi:LOW QUALITY PROTEIN: hypothetical protein KUTeg_023792, partial [Tegillarca granosa]